MFDGYINSSDDTENKSDTGFKKLDEILKGMAAGNLVILAARPKVGKTAFALSIAKNVAKLGKTVAFFSLEMEAKEIYERLLSTCSGISMNTLIDKKFNDKQRPQSIRTEEINKIANAVDEICKLPIKVNDNAGCKVNDIRLEARMIKNLGLIVIDYLTLINGMSRYSGQRQQEVSEISRALKALALELQIPILALAQLSRALEAREDKRPILSDLRESGQIEQDADIVAFLYRDDYHNKEVSTPDNISKIEVILRKNRNGSTGTAELLFKKNTQSFMNYTNDIKEVGDKSE